MSVSLDTELIHIDRFSSFDLGRLVEKLNSRLDGQEIEVSGGEEQKITWYHKLIAGIQGKSVQRHVKYRFALNTANCLLGDKESVLGYALVEEGVYDEHDVEYEGLRLKTLRALKFKNGEDVGPTVIDIEIRYVDEYGNVKPDIRKKYQDSKVENLLPVKFFLKPGLEILRIT